MQTWAPLCVNKYSLLWHFAITIIFSQVCRALIGCKSPSKFLKGAPPTCHVEHFNQAAISHANLLEQKKVLNGKNVHLPQERFGAPKWPSFHRSGTQRVRSIGKSGSGFRIWNRTRNPKTDFNAEISVFGFPFYRSLRKWKTVLKTERFLARACIISKKKTAVHENYSFANPFPDFPIEW